MATRRKAIFIILILIGAALGVVVATHFQPGDAVKISDGVPLQAPNDNIKVTYYGETNVSLENAFPESDTVRINSEAGNISLASSGPTEASIHTSNVTGTWTNVTDITAGGTWIEIYPESKQRVDTRGDVNELSIRQINLDDGTSDLWYSGPNGGSVAAKLYSLPSNTDIVAVDANTGNYLDGVTTDANGNATFDLPASSHAVELNTVSSSAPTFSNPVPSDGSAIRVAGPTLEIDVDDADFSGGDSVDVTIDVDGTQVHIETITSAQTVTTTVSGLSEGTHTWTVEGTDSWGNTNSASYTFTVEHYDPVISNLSPEGLLDQNPSTIDADISDADFGNDGDSLDVNLTLDGTQIDSQTITSNQSLSVNIPQSGLMGGQHIYTWEVTDSYGQTTTATETYSVPDTLYIRNELNHTELVGSPVTVDVTFFGPDNIYNRTTSDGTLNMTGLPVNSDFIAVASPSDSNWTTRALYVTSIYEQQSLYLLNTSVVETIESRFELDDPTGEYGSQSIVQIQRPIEINGTTMWQTIHADRFGTEGVTVTLEADQRYRVRILSGDGTQQVVGPYRADVGETVTVQPGAPTLDIPEFEDGYTFNASISNSSLEYYYEDPDQLTDQLTVWIHEKGNVSNQLVANSSYFDIGSAYNEIQLDSNESEKTWVVKFIVDRDGKEFTNSVTLSNQKDLFDPLAPGLQAAAGILLLFLLAGAFSYLNAGIGAVIVSLAAGLLWFIGLLSGVVSGILIAIAISVAVVFSIAKSSGP